MGSSRDSRLRINRKALAWFPVRRIASAGDRAMRRDHRRNSIRRSQSRRRRPHQRPKITTRGAQRRSDPQSPGADPAEATDLLLARLDQIVDMGHPLAKLAATIDWGFLEQRFGAVYGDVPGRRPLSARLMAGLAILKRMHDLSDEALCDRWIENPYFQLYLRRGVLPAQADLRPLVADALAPAHGRGEARRAHPGEPCECDAQRRAEAFRLFQNHRRRLRAGEGRLSDRREADASAPGAPSRLLKICPAWL